MAIERDFSEGKTKGLPRYGSFAMSLLSAQLFQDLQNYPRVLDITAIRSPDESQTGLSEDPKLVLQQPLVGWASRAADRLNEENQGLNHLLTLPWSPDTELDLGYVASMFVVYSRDRVGPPIPEPYYPKEKVHEIVSVFDMDDGLLTIERQMELINRDPKELIAGGIALTLALRELGRLSDPKLGLGRISDNTRLGILKRLPAFPLGESRPRTDDETKLGMTVGDYYHFTTTTFATLINLVVRGEKESRGTLSGLENQKHVFFDNMCARTAQVAKIKGEKKYPFGLHPNADRLGYETGHLMWSEIQRQVQGIRGFWH